MIVRKDISGATICLQLLVLLTMSATAVAQVVQFASGPPVIQVSTSVQPAGPNPTHLTDRSGRTITVTYDPNSRVTGLKVGTKYNLSDLKVGYGSDGHISILVYGNGYQLVFHYPPNGTQIVNDNLGNTVTRTASNTGQYSTQSVSDYVGYLASTLSATEALFGYIQPVSGLNSAAAVTTQ